MYQPGLFDVQLRYDKIEACNHTLAKMQRVIDFERFRATLNKLRSQERKSNAGRPPSTGTLFHCAVLAIQK